MRLGQKDLKVVTGVSLPGESSGEESSGGLASGDLSYEESS